MNLDSIVELIGWAFDKNFDGKEESLYTLTTQAPANGSQVIIITDYEGNNFRIEVSR